MKPGSIAGLVGPNGAGKSTLLAVLSGLLRPNHGRVQLRGDDVTNTSCRARAKKGLARTFQQPELFMGLTVREHLMLAHRARVAPQRLWRDMLDPRSLLPPSKNENERVEHCSSCCTSPGWRRRRSRHCHSAFSALSK